MGQDGVCTGLVVVGPAAFPNEIPPLGLMGLISMGGPMAVLIRGGMVSIFLLLLLCCCCFGASSCFFLSSFGSRGDDSVGSSSWSCTSI